MASTEHGEIPVVQRLNDGLQVALNVRSGQVYGFPRVHEFVAYFEPSLGQGSWCHE